MAALCDPEEVAGGEAAPHRVLPANEGFVAHDRGRLQLDDRLEVEAQLVVGDGAVEVGLQRRLLQRAIAEGRIEYRVGTGTARLGLRERGLGVDHQRVDVGREREPEHALSSIVPPRAVMGSAITAWIPVMRLLVMTGTGRDSKRTANRCPESPTTPESPTAATSRSAISMMTASAARGPSAVRSS